VDDKLKIQLGSTENVNSVAVDNFGKIQLDTKFSNIREYDIRNIMSVAEIFNVERQASNVYRIYGGFEYLSLLNNMKQNYEYLEDFFISPLPKSSTLTRKGIDDFDIYLVKPAPSGYTKISNEDNDYLRKFEVVATPTDFVMHNAGYSNSVYNEESYVFNFTKDFDVSTYLDDFGIPIVELFLYVRYRTTSTSWGTNEKMSGTTWSASDGEASKVELYYEAYEIGDIIGSRDKIEYLKNNFSQDVIDEQVYYISTPYKDGTTKELHWKYNPFIPLRLRYFSNELKTANTGTTSYDVEINIPSWATPIDDEGNRVWRSILDQGYIDPLSGDGVDYPFVNGRRYLFDKIVFPVIPDLTHENTEEVFTQILFPAPEELEITPTTNLDKIGNPCQ